MLFCVFINYNLYSHFIYRQIRVSGVYIYNIYKHLVYIYYRTLEINVFIDKREWGVNTDLDI